MEKRASFRSPKRPSQKGGDGVSGCVIGVCDSDPPKIRCPQRASLRDLPVVSCCQLTTWEKNGRRHVRFLSQVVSGQRVTTTGRQTQRSYKPFSPLYDSRCSLRELTSKRSNQAGPFAPDSRPFRPVGSQTVSVQYKFSKSHAPAAERVPMYGIPPGQTSPGIGHPLSEPICSDGKAHSGRSSELPAGQVVVRCSTIGGGLHLDASDACRHTDRELSPSPRVCSIGGTREVLTNTNSANDNTNPLHRLVQ